MSRVNGTLNLTKDAEVIYDNLLIKGIKNDNKFTYKENDITVTLFKEENTIKMKRVTPEYQIEFLFDNGKITTGNYYLSEYHKNLDLKVNTLKTVYHKNNLSIEYELFIEEEIVGHFTFSLELEVESWF